MTLVLVELVRNKRFWSTSKHGVWGNSRTIINHLCSVYGACVVTVMNTNSIPPRLVMVAEWRGQYPGLQEIECVWGQVGFVEQ